MSTSGSDARADTGVPRPLHEEMAEQAVFLHSVLESSVEYAIVAEDLDGRVIAWNEGARRIYGYEVAEAVGQRIAFLHASEDMLLTEVLEKGRWSGTLRQRRKDGSVLCGPVTVTLRRDAAGRPQGLTRISRDGAEWEGIARELKESQEIARQYALALEQSPAAVIITDTTGTIEYVNPRFTRNTGYTAADVLGKTPSLLKSRLTPPQVYADMWATIHAGREWRGEILNKKKDGALFWNAISICPVRDAQGRITKFIGTQEDITDRKMAENAVRESEDRLRTLFETMNMIVLTLDTQGNVDYVNPHCLRLTDYSAEETIGSNWFEKFIPEEQRAAVFAAFADLIASGANAHYQNPVLTRSGEERRISWHNTVLRDAEGRATGSLSVGEDITEQFRLEAQLRQAQKMEAVGRLAGGVAHDFNNLLTAILGYSDLALRRLRPEDPITRSLQEIRKASERATALTRQLLAFSRQQVLAPRVLDLNQLVAGIETMLHRLLGEDIEVVTSLARDVGRVEADPGQLEQVLVNLAVNARDAMPGGGKLTIGTANASPDWRGLGLASAPAGEYVVVTVTDSGQGMDEKTRARIFEPFFTTKEHGKGTGLGLSTVYGIVKQSGGFISVDSEPGRGSTFQVYLPHATGPAQEALPAPEAVRGLRGSETVLLVEDEQAVRELASATLSQHGYRVLAAASPGDALWRCAQSSEPIDLVLTDVVMPQMGGPEMARRLVLLRPAIKVLFMSGYADRADALNRELKADCLLQKPFTPDQLLRRVRLALD